MKAKFNGEITPHECRAMRELYRGDYTHSELAFMFECKDETVARHVNRECPHNDIDDTGPIGAKQRYTDDQLLQAFRLVYDRQPYQEMSQTVYEKHRPDHFPNATTIHRRFDSWGEVRQLAHE